MFEGLEMKRRADHGTKSFQAIKQWAEKLRQVHFPTVFECCVCMLLTACGTLTVREIDATNAEAMRFARSGNLQAEVESLARPLVGEAGTLGIVVGVLLPNGSMQFFGYGVTDQDNGAKIDGDTIFAVGSLSKGFLGALTAVLVDEGVLSWDDTLGKLLPPNTPLSPDVKNITLLQLATHTSGLPRQPITFQTFRYLVQYLFTGENFYRHFDRDYVFDYLADFKVPSQIKPKYSSLGYGILGYVLERRTDLSLDVLLEKKLIHPLELKRTGFVPNALPGYSSRARGHAGDQPKFIQRGKPVPDWEFTKFIKGATGIYSSARDLLTFAAAHLGCNETRLKTALADTLKVRLQQPKEAAAVAWIVDDIDGQRITYQVGLVAGYTSYIGLDVERRTAVVVLRNSFTWTDKVGHKLLNRLARAYDQQNTRGAACR